MSQVIHFWNPDRPGCKPKNVAQAAEMSLRLSEELAPPEPRFHAFLNILLKDWPTKSMLSGPEDSRVSVWFGSPLQELERLDVARFSLSLPQDGGLHLFVAMIEAAQQAGLVAFDDSNGWLWLPQGKHGWLGLSEGKFLPKEDAAQWKRFVKEVRQGPRALTRAEVLKDLLVQVRGLLEPEGWVIRSGEEVIFCDRVIPRQGVRQSITLSSKTVWGEHRFGVEASDVCISVWHDAFDRAVEQLKAQYPEDCKSLDRLNFWDEGKWAGGERSLSATLADLEEPHLEFHRANYQQTLVLDELESTYGERLGRASYQPIDTLAERKQLVHKLHQHIMPLMNSYQTPRALNALMDSGEILRYLPDWIGRVGNDRFYKNDIDLLFFAWMNKSTRLPKLAEWFTEKYLNLNGAPFEAKLRFIAFALSHEPPDVGQFAD